MAADPYNATAPDASVRSITSARGDPRGFTPTTKDGVFKIAWIAGSEIQSIGDDHYYTFLPMAVRPLIPTVDGQHRHVLRERHAPRRRVHAVTFDRTIAFAHRRSGLLVELMARERDPA
jgi:hypothetical protein